MNRLRYRLAMLLLILALSTTACGDGPTAAPNSATSNTQFTANELEYRQAVATLKHLDRAIACGKLDKALSLFGNSATIEVDNPPHLTFMDPIYLWQLFGYRADPETGLVA